MRIGKLILDAVIMLWLPILLVAAWWVLSAGSENFYFPPLADIVETIYDEATDGNLWSNLAFSVINYTIGFVGASILAVVIGVLLGSSPRIRNAMTPLLDFMRAMPQIALVPVVIMAFGIGAAPKMFLIGFICFWPILLNTIDGIRGLNPQLLEVSNAYRVPYFLYLRRVMLPGALPSIMAGMRVSLALGVIMVIVSEMYASTEGLGFYILQSQESYRVTDVWAGTIVIGLLGYAISLGFILVERQVLAWYFQRERKRRPWAGGSPKAAADAGPGAPTTRGRTEADAISTQKRNDA